MRTGNTERQVAQYLIAIYQIVLQFFDCSVGEHREYRTERENFFFSCSFYNNFFFFFQFRQFH
ncbi:hypothetical protein RNJ44_02803 [Nakaseomyces bracarensis]|uniref:Uncharacterized protein n=1 Tax=Nakaseomyces bracarensis TaxID=273131 RepID=A0ABR4P0A7_9SACH